MAIRHGAPRLVLSAVDLERLGEGVYEEVREEHVARTRQRSEVLERALPLRRALLEQMAPLLGELEPHRARLRGIQGTPFSAEETSVGLAPLTSAGIPRPVDELEFYGSPYPITGADHGGTADRWSFEARPSGLLNVSVAVAEDSGAPWAYALVGIYFIPGEDITEVRFSALLSYTYGYGIEADLAPAHCDGYVGARLFSWDRSGENQRQEGPGQTVQVFSDGVDVWDPRHEVQEEPGQRSLELRVAIPPDRGVYAFVAFLDVSMDADGYGGLLANGSYGDVGMGGLVNFMVTEATGWHVGP